MKLLVIIPSQFAGCGFYRLYQPYNHLAKNYGVKVTFSPALKKSEEQKYTDAELQEFDAVIWHKTYFELPDVKKCKDLGIVTIVDFDDHWVLNREHSMYIEYMGEGTAAKLHKLIIEADYVTCTTDRLADSIFEHNENVEVFGNAIDANYNGLNVDRVKEDKYVFGYLGGPCHIRDLGLLKGLQKEMTAKLSGYELRLFGYNGTDIYKHYARILADETTEEGDVKHSPNFSLYKGADIWHYPQFYNHLDCSLIPLESNYFNSMKSELKLIEAGHFKKPCIVSNVTPYTNIIRHKKNCLAVTSKRDWFDSAKMLLDNKNLGVDLGEQLHEDTQRFSIDAINKKRFKFLEQCTTKRHFIQPEVI